MDVRAPKKGRKSKENRVKAQEKFASKIPYRFCLLKDPSPEALKPWESVKSKHMEQNALQRTLVPTRSIPIKGTGAPVLGSPSSLCPPRTRSPLSYLWELQLLSRRFSGSVAKC